MVSSQISILAYPFQSLLRLFRRLHLSPRRRTAALIPLLLLNRSAMIAGSSATSLLHFALAVVFIPFARLFPQLCATFACDIYKHLRASEIAKVPLGCYLIAFGPLSGAAICLYMDHILTESSEEIDPEILMSHQSGLEMIPFRENLQSSKLEFNITEDASKSLQSVEQIIGEVLRPLDNKRSVPSMWLAAAVKWTRKN